jgi:hypothetical protein
MSDDGSCREALRKFLVWLFLEQGKTASPNTCAYCKARSRLRQKDIEDVHGQILGKTQEENKEKFLWYGRDVKVIDGSSVSMPDTPENQKAYPQPGSQKPGCGFPVMRIVAIFSLATGTLLALAKDALSVHERDLFRRLWHMFDPGDVALADRGFCSFADIYHLSLRGVDCVMRKHQARKVGQTLLKRLSKNDRLVEWHKTRSCPTWLTKEQWRAMPERITLREIKVVVKTPGFRTKRIFIVTTLLDPKEYPAHEFAQLYLMRWRAELYLRDIKIIMGMDILRCKSPEMVEKELWMHIIAYNLIRAVMAEAAVAYNVSICRLSFKGTAVTIRQWSQILARRNLTEHQRNGLYELLLYYIAKDKNPYRPNRVEPRAKKRRPKAYQLLTKPRKIFKEIPHRGKIKEGLS